LAALVDILIHGQRDEGRRTFTSTIGRMPGHGGADADAAVPGSEIGVS